MRLPFALVVALVLAAPACGGGAEERGGPQGRRSETAVSIEEAQRRGGLQLVRGTLIADGRDVRLCSAVLESFPPQCGEPSLLVEGADPDALRGTRTVDGVTWSDGEIALQGEVDGDVLRVRE